MNMGMGMGMGMGGMPVGINAIQPIMVPQSGALEALKNMNGLVMAQNTDMVQMMTGLSMPHKFNFFPINADGTQNPNRIFRANEQSDPLVRQMLTADDYPFRMNIMMTNGMLDLFNFMMVERPMNCCTCHNGELRIYAIEGGFRQIGVVRGPCTFCSYELHVFDMANNLKFKMTGTPCQLGVQCGKCCPMDSCQHSEFYIEDATGNQLSNIAKKTNFCNQCLGGSADTYFLRFPATATVEDKMLLIGANLLFDFVYFEDHSRGHRRHHHHHRHTATTHSLPHHCIFHQSSASRFILQSHPHIHIVFISNYYRLLCASISLLLFDHHHDSTFFVVFFVPSYDCLVL